MKTTTLCARFGPTTGNQGVLSLTHLNSYLTAHTAYGVVRNLPEILLKKKVDMLVVAWAVMLPL